MSPALRRSGTVLFRGSPTSLSAVVRGSARTAGGPARVTLDLPIELDAPPIVQVAPQAGTDLAAVIVRLPEYVPPGKYPGKIDVGGRQHDIEVEVEPRPRVRILPRRTRLRAVSGQRVEFAITIVNRGNVVVTVPRADAIGLFAEDGMDRALGVALGEQVPDGERRIDVLAEELSVSHGGVARLRLVDGAGDLEPGDARESTVALDVPKKTRAGHAYWGVWSFYNVNYLIEIEVTGEGEA